MVTKYGLKNGAFVTLTPNVREFNLLCSAFSVQPEAKDSPTILSSKLDGALIFCKGRIDRIAFGSDVVEVSSEGSPRRCGGQGDIICGILAAFIIWAQKLSMDRHKRLNTAVNASIMMRELAKYTFEVHGRGFLTGDLLANIHTVMRELTK